MDLPQEVDNFIKESIDDSLGLLVSTRTLQLKLQASQNAQCRLRDQYLQLRSKLKEKDETIESARAESSMNAQALKKFVEENQKLAVECANLLSQSDKWEQECSLYDHDREALMDFGNEADERAKEAETRIHELEQEFKRLSNELCCYKDKQHETCVVDSSSEPEETITEERLLESVLSTVANKGSVMSTYSFLEANNAHEPCQSLLKKWNGLRPSTQRFLSLVAEVKSLEKDKEHLRINLDRAEDEVKMLFVENNILDKENTRLLKQYNKDGNHQSSDGKHTGSSSAKSNKRKSSPRKSSSIVGKIDFSDLGSPRQPLSPLQYNSPEPRMHKKLFS